MKKYYYRLILYYHLTISVLGFFRDTTPHIWRLYKTNGSVHWHFVGLVSNGHYQAAWELLHAAEINYIRKFLNVDLNNLEELHKNQVVRSDYDLKEIKRMFFKNYHKYRETARKSKFKPIKNLDTMTYQARLLLEKAY